MNWFTLPPEKQNYLEKMKTLAQEQFLPRAAHYDATIVFPKENIEDLKTTNLLGSLIDKQYGGLGLGHEKGDIYTHWMMTREIAKADMGFARVWEGHSNAMALIDTLGTPTQKEKWLTNVVQNGEIWGVWSGEPQAKKPGQKAKFGTTVTETNDGYLINGTKIFCSGAPMANWAVILVNTQGTGGARHATQSPETLLMLGADMNDTSITLDASWWNPIGMRTSCSFLVRFDNTFIPKENLIGPPGEFLLNDWQTRFTPQYAVTLLGGAESAYDYALNYIKTQQKGQDAYIQHRVGRMALNLKSAHLWMRKVATLWETGDIENAKLEGNCLRYLVEQFSMETVQHAIHACGARSLIRPSQLERIYRDLSFYARHDNDDQLLGAIGRSIVGEAYDVSFFKT